MSVDIDFSADPAILRSGTAGAGAVVFTGATGFGAADFGGGEAFGRADALRAGALFAAGFAAGFLGLLLFALAFFPGILSSFRIHTL